MSESSLRAFLKRRISREEAVGLSFTLSFVACATLAAVVGWLAHEILLEAGKPGAFDVRVSEFLIGLRSRRLTGLMATASAFGDHRFLLVATSRPLRALERRPARLRAAFRRQRGRRFRLEHGVEDRDRAGASRSLEDHS